MGIWAYRRHGLRKTEILARGLFLIATPNLAWVMPDLDHPMKILFKHGDPTHPLRPEMEQSVHEDWDSFLRRVGELTGKGTDEAAELAAELLDARILSVEHGVLEAMRAD